MSDPDLGRILELRKTVRWSADPRTFGLLREMREARWAIAEDGPAVVGMVGAVPLGKVGILCHLAVRRDYRKLGLGFALSSWSVSYLRFQGVKVVWLDSTRGAKRLYESLGFESVSRRSVYRLEGGVLAIRLRGRLLVTPLSFGDLPELYGGDRRSFGGDHSALIRATLNLRPGRELIARDASGRINGYLVRSTYESTVRIGSLMLLRRMLLAPCSHTHSRPTAAVPSRFPCPARSKAQRTGFSASSASSDGGTGSVWRSARHPARMVSKLWHHAVPGYVAVSEIGFQKVSRASSGLRYGVVSGVATSPAASWTKCR
jgi:ribosomal protein S18 acetylase RimI-like enzyme